MVKTIDALFDGTVFHPTEPVGLARHARHITIETMLPGQGPRRVSPARHGSQTSMVLPTGQRTSIEYQRGVPGRVGG